MYKRGHLSDEEIALYAEAISANKVMEMDESIRAHVMECDECAEKTLVVAEINEDFHKTRNNTLLKKNSFNKSFWLQIAASIILITGIGFIVYQTKLFDKNNIQQITELVDSSNLSTDTSFIAKKENIQVIKEHKDTAVNKNLPEKQKTPHQNLLAYAENQELEKLVDRFTNAALRGGFSVKIKSTVEIKQGEELFFEWKNEGEELLTIEFFDNTGYKLLEEETSENTFKTKKIKNPGLYYWKLLNEDFDLLFCGKIIVQ